MAPLHKFRTLPTAEVPIVYTLDPNAPQALRVQPAWYAFFASIVGPAPAIETVSVGPSPFTYIASVYGNLFITGGTVTGLVLTRGRVSLGPFALTDHFLPLSLQDQLTITYTALPGVWFIPIGAVT
jgi:hypothetical protein